MNGSVHDHLHNNTVYLRGISPAAATTDNTAWVSEIIDTKNYKAVEFILQLGAFADADATFTALLEEGDVSNLSDNAAVSDDDMYGTEAECGFQFDDDNETRKIGYRGYKRYIRLTVTPANNTGNAFLAGVAACVPVTLLPA